MEPITYTWDEADQYDSFTLVIEWIQKFLESDSDGLLTEALIQRIREHCFSPDGWPDLASWSDSFFAIEQMADQTPYTHPWSARLARLAVALMGRYDMAHELQEVFSTYGGVEHRIRRADWEYQMHLTDHEMEPDQEGYVNRNAVTSLVYAEKYSSDWADSRAIYPLRRAFEEDETNEASIIAAAVWIINYGFVIYWSSFHPRHDNDSWFFAGRKYERMSRTSKPSSKIKKLFKRFICSIQRAFGCYPDGIQPEDYLSRDRWMFWKQGFRAAGSGFIAGHSRMLSTECRNLARQAAEKMDELEDDSMSNNSSAISLQKEKGLDC